MDMCGCLGPQQGDPYCPCTMDRMGLKRNLLSFEEQNEITHTLEEILKEYTDYLLAKE